MRVGWLHKNTKRLEKWDYDFEGIYEEKYEENDNFDFVLKKSITRNEAEDLRFEDIIAAYESVSGDLKIHLLLSSFC